MLIIPHTTLVIMEARLRIGEMGIALLKHEIEQKEMKFPGYAAAFKRIWLAFSMGFIRR